jgi:hypothetical protein
LSPDVQPFYEEDEIPLLLNDVFYQNLAAIVQETSGRLDYGRLNIPFPSAGPKETPEAVRRSQPPILESTALNHFVSPGRGALSSHLGSPSTIPGADSSFASQTTPDSDAALEGTVFRDDLEAAEVTAARAVLEKAEEQDAIERMARALARHYAEMNGRRDPAALKLAEQRFQSMVQGVLRQLADHCSSPDHEIGSSVSVSCQTDVTLTCSVCGNMQSSLRTKKGFLKATARLQAAYALHGGQDQEGQVSVWPSNMTVGTKQAIEAAASPYRRRPGSPHDWDEPSSFTEPLYPGSWGHGFRGPDLRASENNELLSAKRLQRKKASSTRSKIADLASDRAKVVHDIFAEFQQSPKTTAQDLGRWCSTQTDGTVETEGTTAASEQEFQLHSTSHGGPGLRHKASTAAKPALLVHMEDFAKRFAPAVDPMDNDVYEKRWAVYRKCLEIFMHATPTYGAFLKRILDENDMLLSQYRDALAKPQQLLEMLHEGEAEKRKAIAQVEKQLWDSEQELKKAATAHAAEVRALQASLQEKDAQIRGIQSQMQAFTDVKELYSKMLLDDCDELRIRRMLVSKTCQYRTLLHKTNQLEQQVQALEEAKRNHEKREIRMTQEMTEVLNDRACGAAALEELQKDHAALMEDCQSLKHRLSRMRSVSIMSFDSGTGRRASTFYPRHLSDPQADV